jgi:O-antigen ligase
MLEAQRAGTLARSDTARWLANFMLAGVVLLMVLLPFQLVIKALIPGFAGTYWKELLLGLLVVLWLIRCGQERRLLLTGTSLDAAVLIYIGLLVLGFILGRAGQTAAWGFYVSAMYVPLFWILPTTLADRPAWAERLVLLLALVGGLVALGGLIEFLLNQPLWPSSEITSRQGFPDVFVYGTHLRRVYFVLDSPTVLANMLSALLPLALTGVLLVRRTWQRILLAGCAVIMAACIVVTFSRGIWVATVVALALMLLLSDVMQQRRRLLLGGAAVLVAALLTWGVVALVQPGHGATASPAVVELPRSSFEAAPVTAETKDLLGATPMQARPDTQTWTIQDPIAGGDDTRPVLYQAPSAEGKAIETYRVTVPATGALRFGIGMAPAVWAAGKGDGATFVVYVADPGARASAQSVFSRYINPKLTPADRRWRNFLVDLSPWAGRTVDLSFVVEAGPAGDWAYDWAGWSTPQVVAIAPGYFAKAQVGNQAVQHAGSVLNWTTDETNRDRLAGWRSGLAAWLRSPLLGQGLGTTGVAALRTNPSRAVVTESQVLKSLVELGIPGLLALAYLWLQIGRVGYRGHRAATDPRKRVLLLGILTSLLIIFIEGWVYQNLEVKQVNAYFWVLTGMVGFLGSKAG